MIIYATAWRGSDKFKDSIFKNTKTFSVSKVRIYIVPFNYCNKKERLVEEIMSNVKKGNIINVSAFFRYWFKKVLGSFVFV